MKRLENTDMFKLTANADREAGERLSHLLHLALGANGRALKFLEILSVALGRKGEGKLSLLLFLAEPHIGVLHWPIRLGMLALLHGQQPLELDRCALYNSAHRRWVS